MSTQPFTVLCLASYEKGQEFMRECKRQGARVFLLTSQSIAGADWPRESLDDIFLIPDKDKEWNRQDVIYGVSYMARNHRIDRIVPLDDFDVETGAALREHLRIGGMGDTTARYFRDKLAMRVRAKEAAIAVPDFVHVLHYDALREFMKRVPGPWLVKPRMQASALGIKKIHHEEELWRHLDHLGDKQSFYLMERFVEGDVYHVDSVISERAVVFACASKYGKPPMHVAHQGDVFTTKTLSPTSAEAKAVLKANKTVLQTLGLVRGVSHTEFIMGKDGTVYFLETSARVGGANIAELVEAATGVNLWREWAKIECEQGEKSYMPPIAEKNTAALLISLAKQEHPDMSAYNDPEVWWKMNRKHHAGLIVTSPKASRVDELLESYLQRFYNDFFTTAPLPDKATN
ncbi:MAG: ATP-grasp domain-containing protein [Chloroherpetonaceae bacterium]|nr:ATP-grasp domain-containing protein [Chloroherpetonaceae bacterium]